MKAIFALLAVCFVGTSALASDLEMVTCKLTSSSGKESVLQAKIMGQHMELVAQDGETTATVRAGMDSRYMFALIDNGKVSMTSSIYMPSKGVAGSANMSVLASSVGTITCSAK